MFRVTAVTAAFSAVTFLSLDLPAKPALPDSARALYIVVLRDSPAATHATTKPVRGKRLNKQDASVVSYTDSLRANQDSMLARVGGARKVYSYTYALNGFAAELNAAQVAQLRADRNVVSVVRNEIHKLRTSTTPAFLGLNAPNGAWDQAGGAGFAGDDVIVGVIDSGIWPENPSFTPRPPTAGRPPGWSGICEAGEQFPATICNSKLIGARFYNQGFGGDDAIRSIFNYEYVSPRAAEGHGVHTAGTAVGNYRVPAQAQGIQLGFVSGMAPGARLAVYKVCWGFEDDPAAGCATADSVAAIDQAVGDGVDVINFSVGDFGSSYVDPIEFAFLLAADAGVFVAAAAGNDGALGAGRVDHTSPWLTTVAMGTHDRRYEAAVVFANGARFDGVSLDDKGVGNHQVVLAADAAARTSALAALCLPGTLDPTVVSGRIVVCDRGENTRVEKSQVVGDAGGVGMILVNTSPNTLNADLHFVPTVHLDEMAGANLKRYVARNPAVLAKLTAGKIVTGTQVPAPNVDPNSSRGPSIAGKGDLLKPDLLAPGVDVLAAYSPVRTGNDFEFLSGTSMATPHVAGIAAILRQAHPRWSPAEIQSALMTTATTRRNDGKAIREEAQESLANPFGYGAGFVQPNQALDPGLVYDAGLEDWLAFICGTGTACFDPIPPIDPSDLNYPSIAIGDFVGRQTVHRTVTNVANHRSTYSVSVEAPPGISVEVQPSTFSIEAGATRSFQVRFARTSASLDRYVFGAMTWSDGQHKVRSPIVIRSGALEAPTEIRGNGAPLQYAVTFGYTGPFSATARGLVPAKRFVRTVRDDPANDIDTAIDTRRGLTIVAVRVPAGTSYARFSLFNDSTDGNDDLDLHVFRSDGTFVGSSTNLAADEEVSIQNPAADTYLVAIHGFETDGPDAKFTLFAWALGTAPAGNMTVSVPSTAKLNGKGTVQLKFSKLGKTQRYLGSVAYGGASGMPQPTIVRVDR